MSIRIRFTLLISVAALLSAAVFSSFVYVELREEHYKLTDRELLDVGDAIFNKCLKDESDQFSFDADTAQYPLDRYWIRLTGPDSNIVYQSRIGEMTDIPIRSDASAYFTEGRISLDDVWIDPADEDEREELRDENVRFRVVTTSQNISGTELFLAIAKPVPVMAAELTELLYEVAVWTIVAVLLVIVVSYFLAGRMLKPLNTINRLTREIRESSLHKRIPVGNNQDELYTLTESLNSMFDRLEHSFQRQKEFVSNASHELKSPLTILRLGLEDLLSTPLPDNVREEITAQLKTTQKIQKLIQDLLDISRLEQQDAISRDHFSVNGLISEVLKDFNDIFKSRNMRISLPAQSFSVSADRDKLKRVFINLIDNAVKYNHPCNGWITFGVERTDRNVEISVANSGPPIPEHDLPRIFDQFFRVEKSRSHHYGGTGLGLTIVKKIVALHGGSVHASSDSDQTVITLILPLIETE